MSLADGVRQWFFQQRRGLRVVQDCIGWKCGNHTSCVTNPQSGAEKKAAQTLEIEAKWSLPVGVSVFMLVVCCGCCIACVSGTGGKATSGRGRRIGRDGEDTPLVPASWKAAGFYIPSILEKAPIPPAAAEEAASAADP